MYPTYLTISYDQNGHNGWVVSSDAVDGQPFGFYTASFCTVFQKLEKDMCQARGAPKSVFSSCPFQPALKRGTELQKQQLSCQLSSGILFPFFAGGCPIKNPVFPEKGSLFFQGHWTTETEAMAGPLLQACDRGAQKRGGRCRHRRELSEIEFPPPPN